MMDWSTAEFASIMTVIAPYAVFFTQMYHANAIIHRPTLLEYQLDKQPLVLQLGGSDPKTLQHAAQIAHQTGYRYINLNVGCPSSKVQKGEFGVCLMKTPQRVGECIKAIAEVIGKHGVSIKCRIGVDEQEDYKFLAKFIEVCLIEGGCDWFYIHARKAFLNGLNPKENRNIPPLIYDRVYQIKQDFSHCHIGINGGVGTWSAVKAHLLKCDGVMIGRLCYKNPYLLYEIHQLLYQKEVAKRSELIVKMSQLSSLHRQSLINIYKGCLGSSQWKALISNKNSDWYDLIELAKNLDEKISQKTLDHHSDY